ncbi:zf-PARP-domain-containing [Micractinium conductrix]|uniref:Zf-PARP-domain-containing n=1 Tax=Micractinium conductrix TaxID=554055 RepID=A0A2P6V8D3_9CHLO|nr:zf-PARP-domain-containing [Micractinium conductrix]|eukprot:PSC70344.1 zf-PARP-domain-containing [Micractinium conductrix]
METNPYCIQYAKSGRAICTACENTIGKGELRLGSPVVFHDAVSYKWRHWTCTTPAVLNNMAGKIGRHSVEAAITGMEDLKPQDRERVIRAIQTGAVEKKEHREGEAGYTGSEEEEGQEAPAPPVRTPRKRAPSRKAQETAAAQEAGEEDEEWVPSSKKKKAPARRAAAAVHK